MEMRNGRPLCVSAYWIESKIFNWFYTHNTIHHITHSICHYACVKKSVNCVQFANWHLGGAGCLFFHKYITISFDILHFFLFDQQTHQRLSESNRSRNIRIHMNRLREKIHFQIKSFFFFYFFLFFIILERMDDTAHK